jgi:hypothetical protein
MNDLKFISLEKSKLLIRQKLFKRINEVLTLPSHSNKIEIHIGHNEIFLIEHVCKCLKETNWRYSFDYVDRRYKLCLWQEYTNELSLKVIKTFNGKLECIVLSPCQKYLFGIDKNTIFKLDLKNNVKQTIVNRKNLTRFRPFRLMFSNDVKQLFVLDRLNGMISICTLTGVSSIIDCKYADDISTDFRLCNSMKLSPDGKQIIVDSNVSLCIQTMFVSKCDIQFDNYFKFVNHCNIISPVPGIVIALSSCKHNIDIIDSENYNIIETIYFERKINNFVMSKNFILYVYDYNFIYSIDLSHMFKNLKMFIQLQLSNYSHLSRRLINTF